MAQQELLKEVGAKLTELNNRFENISSSEEVHLIDVDILLQLIRDIYLKTSSLKKDENSSAQIVKNETYGYISPNPAAQPYTPAIVPEYTPHSPPHIPAQESGISDLHHPHHEIAPVPQPVISFPAEPEPIPEPQKVPEPEAVPYFQTIPEPETMPEPQKLPEPATVPYFQTTPELETMPEPQNLPERESVPSPPEIPAPATMPEPQSIPPTEPEPAPKPESAPEPLFIQKPAPEPVYVPTTPSYLRPVSSQPELFGNGSLSDKHKSDTISINDRMVSGKSDHTLADKIKLTPLRDIKAAIGINEKFQFINELFEGSGELYNEAISLLNNCTSAYAANQLFADYQRRNNWDTENKAFLKFKEYVDRRYLQS